jgi:hypothetical protein
MVDMTSKVTVETKVIVVVVVWKMIVGQMSGSVDGDIGAVPERDGVVVKVPLFVDVGTAVDAAGEELPVTMQEQAEEIRVGSYWH